MSIVRADVPEPQRDVLAAHQPGQDVLKSLLSEDIDWKPFAAFPPSVRLAVVVGEPSHAGPYTITRNERTEDVVNGFEASWRASG